MKRKIIKLGQATFVMSIPAKWMKKYKLAKGDYLEVNEEGKKLVLTTESVLQHKKVVVKLPKSELFLKRFILNPYRFGYDEVVCQMQNADVVHKIERAITFCPGFEIVQQTEKNCTVRNVSPKMEGEFDNIFRRLFFLLHQFLKESVDLIKQKEFSKLEEIAQTENSVVDKLVCFCERVINRRGSGNFMKNSYLYISVWGIEQVGDLIKNMCRTAASLKEMSKETEELWQDAEKFFDQFSRLYFKPDLMGAINFKEDFANLHNEIIAKMKKTSGEESIILYYMASLTNRINDIAVSVHEFSEDQETFE
jgi:phosphate uptake regulator